MLIPILVLFFAGLFTGVISGFLGIGGGAVLIPFLLIYLKDVINPDYLFLTASATSLFGAFVSGIFSSRKHIKNNNFYKKLIFPLALGAFLGTFPGNYLSITLDSIYLQITFVVLLFYVAIKMIFSKTHREMNKNIANINESKFLPAFIVGLLAGVISPITGIGGGVIFVPILSSVLNLDVKKSAGTSACVMFFTTLPGIVGRVYNGLGVTDIVSNASSLTSIHFGFLFLWFTLPVIVGVSLSASFGAHLNYKMNADKFKKIAGIIFLIISFKMLFSLI